MPEELETDDILRTHYPTMFDHVIKPGNVAKRRMGDLRVHYLALAENILALCPPGRSRGLAMTALEDSLMRAIQSLALTGELVDTRIPFPTPLQSTMGNTIGSTGDLPTVSGEGDAGRTD